MQYIAISGGQTFRNRLQFPYENSEEMETTIRNIRKTLRKRYKIGGKLIRKQAQKSKSMDVSSFKEREKSMKSVMSKQKGKRRKNKKRLRKDFVLEENDMSTEGISNFETLNDSEYEDESSDEISYYESFSESECDRVENTEEMYETLDEITDEISFGTLNEIMDEISLGAFSDAEYDIEEKTVSTWSDKEYDYYKYPDELCDYESEYNDHMDIMEWLDDLKCDDYESRISDAEYDEECEYLADVLSEMIDAGFDLNYNDDYDDYY